MTAENLHRDSACRYVTWRGSSFQRQAAATGKARLPIVDNRVRHTISDDDAARIGDLEPPLGLESDNCTDNDNGKYSIA